MSNYCASCSSLAVSSGERAFSRFECPLQSMLLLVISCNVVESLLLCRGLGFRVYVCCAHCLLLYRFVLGFILGRSHYQRESRGASAVCSATTHFGRRWVFCDKCLSNSVFLLCSLVRCTLVLRSYCTGLFVGVMRQLRRN